MLDISQTLDRDADYSTEDGAHRLAASIRKYWRNRGLFPRVWVSKMLTTQSATAQPTVRFIVRSHMVGGQPV